MSTYIFDILPLFWPFFTEWFVCLFLFFYGVGGGVKLHPSASFNHLIVFLDFLTDSCGLNLKRLIGGWKTFNKFHNIALKFLPTWLSISYTYFPFQVKPSAIFRLHFPDFLAFKICLSRLMQPENDCMNIFLFYLLYIYCKWPYFFIFCK